MLLFVLPFQRGIRGWNISVVTAGPEPWMSAYAFYFGFSLKLIFSFAILLLLFLSPIKTPLTKKGEGFLWILASFFGWALLSVVVTGGSTVSWLGLISLIIPLSAFFSGRVLFVKGETRFHALEVFIAGLAFLGLIGAKQLLSQRPIGLFLEDNAFRNVMGFFTADGAQLYRVSGLFGHPTFFGSYLSLVIPIASALTALSFIQKRRNYVAVGLFSLTTILGLLALFGTLSRSAWIATGGAIALLVVVNLETFRRFYNKISLALLIFFLSLFVLFGGTLLDRLTSLNAIWSQGTGVGRIYLLEQAFYQISKFSLFGVGLNRFTEIMSAQDLPVVVRNFLFPVHNTFLLFFSETGIPGGLLFIIFAIGILYSTLRRATKSLISFSVWVSAATFMVNSQFHTLFHQDPSLDMFMVLLAYLSVI
ncbi:MAG: O-antigen ligase family protein [Patescibacteria group bacterium]